MHKGRYLTISAKSHVIEGCDSVKRAT